MTSILFELMIMKDPPGLSWLETKDGIHKSTNNLDDILCLAENEKQRVQQIHRKGSEIQVYSSLDMFGYGYGFVLVAAVKYYVMELTNFMLFEIEKRFPVLMIIKGNFDEYYDNINSTLTIVYYIIALFDLVGFAIM
ncbi:hypothetical protein C2G38_2246206 [Gigaspora rosea]|uniref:Uncharacterized protein n=1 Tax=Gigaspora rosea TaxID=44941 RepID=A0A397V5K6_9GLOM|nr:hypothetical protein C2G38_2246206 [Gigaspora rosea]